MLQKNYVWQRLLMWYVKKYMCVWVWLAEKRKGKTFNQIQVETALIQLGFRCNIWRNISIFN